MNLEAIHISVEGRARFRVDAFNRNEELIHWVCTQILSIPGILRAAGNPLSSTLLIEYQSRENTSGDLKKIIQRLLKCPPKNLKEHRKKQISESYWHTMCPDKVASHFQVKLDVGLSSQRLKKRRLKSGFNLLPRPASRTQFSILSNQFKSLPVVLLIGSAAVSILMGGVVDGAVILGVVLINGGIGYVMESTSEKAIHSLLKSQRLKSRVLRDGNKIEIPFRELLPGDILLIGAGDIIPADARIIESEHLTVDESILTGESLPVLKMTAELSKLDLPLADRCNMLFKGTVATGGSAKAIVVAIGSFTEVGKVQRLVSESVAPQTPIQRELDRLGNQMAAIAFFSSGIILVLGIARGHRILGILKTAVSMAVAAIPEALPTVATMTLTRGLKNLEKHDVLIRRLDAVETLANVDIVCFDKTGTLTLNHMRVCHVSLIRARFDVSTDCLNRKGRKIVTRKYPTLQKLLSVAVLCNEAKTQGSTTEGTLLKLAEVGGIDINNIRKTYPLLKLEYRSESRHYMKTIHRKFGSEEELHCIKGAPIDVLELCQSFRMGNSTYSLTKKIRKKVLCENKRLAQKGFRVLGFAIGESNKDGLTWLGLAAMEDPLRPGVQELIRRLHLAGIQTVMLTGDQELTASAIGSQVGIGRVYARVSPSRKLEIIKELQLSGKIVAMIGDGVNDGPALKAANIGIAMAADGAEIASQAADVVLPNSNIEKIIFAIQEGRAVHEDIKKAVDYIVSQNLSEMLFTFVSVLIGTEEPMSPMQFLWVNLVTDVFPELALAQEPPEKNLLKLSPLKFDHGILHSDDLEKIIIESTALSSAPIVAYLIGQISYKSQTKARALAFTTMTTSSLFYTFCARSRKISIFDRERLKRNNYVPLAMGAGFLAELAWIVSPALRSILKTQDLTKREIALSTIGSVVPFLTIETTKFVRKKLAA